MDHNVVDSFAGEYRFLSNFYPSPIRVDGLLYPTVEHAFQAAKTPDKEEKRKIADARSPGRAKALGRKVRLRKDWESVKVGIMKQLVLLKFREHPDLEERLLATDDAELIEGNTWNDRFWGVCNGHGKNHLGKALMWVRTQLQEENDAVPD
ncbi:MAG: NADAR family protein [Planctomycetaceae bacterium]|nr:NADAR family protein [Planctomycetaceae bacterium]